AAGTFGAEEGLGGCWPRADGTDRDEKTAAARIIASAFAGAGQAAAHLARRSTQLPIFSDIASFNIFLPRHPSFSCRGRIFANRPFDFRKTPQPPLRVHLQLHQTLCRGILPSPFSVELFFQNRELCRGRRAALDFVEDNRTAQ